MRKIKTIKDQGKKDRMKQFVVGGFLIFIMFFSVLGYGFYNQSGEENGNKIAEWRN